MRTYKTFSQFLMRSSALGKQKSDLDCTDWRGKWCANIDVIGGRHIASRKIERRRCWDGMMVGRTRWDSSRKCMPKRWLEAARSIGVTPLSLKASWWQPAWETWGAVGTTGKRWPIINPLMMDGWCRKARERSWEVRRNSCDVQWWTYPSSEDEEMMDGMMLARGRCPHNTRCVVYATWWDGWSC